MKGPALLLAGILFFSLLDANSKLLSGHYAVGQVIALRFAVLVPLFLVARALRPGFGGPLGTRRPGLHALRVAAMMVSAASFFLGFRHLPLAEGYLVFFTAPLITLALSALVLKEAVPRAAWLWCLLGFAGVVLAVAPRLGGGGGPLAGYLAVMTGTLAFSVTQTVNRRLRAEPGLVGVVLWPGLVGLLVFGPLALRDWVPPPPADLLRLGLNGLLAGGAVVLAAAAYRHADAARLGPYGFAALPVSVALDIALWDVWPDPATLAGGAVVVFACLMSERARRTAAAPLAVPPRREPAAALRRIPEG
ncbi:DMT family transporter [Paracraurococcus lichenis]|uniref:DMT family transporter n=1 Tax=Paracraurococcus lichenis TaxID=3064888 RepID=A0ABT9DXQ5_9PROT|nr:DMT family transporter [Paracraurococcus sp. LOR1-02]MDO9708683.1 DMT family transporter [Paracraurococcus sp. LOR1-02]